MGDSHAVIVLINIETVEPGLVVVAPQRWLQALVGVAAPFHENYDRRQGAPMFLANLADLCELNLRESELGA